MQVAGKVFLTINGQRLRSKEGAELETGGIKREAVVSDSGVDGYVETIVAPKVTAKVSLTNDVRLEDIQAFKDGTLTFETDTGRVFTLTNAFNEDPPKLVKGEVSLVFGAEECLEG
ncbi:MAG: phage tail tube protein [Polaromonas sp.]